MRFAILLLSVWMSIVAQAAEPRGRISGAVASNGAPVPDAPVQAKNSATGAAFRAFSGADGEFTLGPLPLGEYTVSVRMPGFKFLPFARVLTVSDRERHPRVDVELDIGNLDTLGDDPYTFLRDVRDASASLTGPAPRGSDGHPDLSGVWFGNDDLFPEDPALLPWAAEVVRNRLANDLRDLPRGQCLPGGVLPVGPFFRKLVQTPNLLVVLNEDDVLGFRQIFLDGRKSPEGASPSWQGHSVGRWVGQDLIVEDTGFNDSSVMGIYPHTEQLHVVERYHRRNFGHMDVQITVEDPGALEQPWNIHMVWDLAPDQELTEFVCGESILNMHLEWRSDFHELRDEILRTQTQREKSAAEAARAGR